MPKRRRSLSTFFYKSAKDLREMFIRPAARHEITLQEVPLIFSMERRGASAHGYTTLLNYSIILLRFCESVCFIGGMWNETIGVCFSFVICNLLMISNENYWCFTFLTED